MAKKLDVVWKKAPVSKKWKLIMYDAVVGTKLTYALETIPLSDADKNRIDSFHIRGLRKILRIQHPYWSRVSNDEIYRRASEGLDKPITKLSKRITKMQVKLLGHVIRLPEEDTMRRVTLCGGLNRTKLSKKRVGRPRLKWLDKVVPEAMKVLVEKGYLPLDYETNTHEEERIEMMINLAKERLF